LEGHIMECVVASITRMKRILAEKPKTSRGTRRERRERMLQLLQQTQK